MEYKHTAAEAVQVSVVVGYTQCDLVRGLTSHVLSCRSSQLRYYALFRCRRGIPAFSGDIPAHRTV